MSSQQELSARMTALGERIDASLDRLRLEHALYSEHGPTGEELKKRYEIIQDTVASEVESLEEKGHHVSALEKSILAWLEHLNFDR